MKEFEIRATDIEWDTDNEEVDLPTETTFRVSALSKEDAEDMAVDELSARYEYCIFSLNIEVKEKEEEE